MNAWRKVLNLFTPHNRADAAEWEEIKDRFGKSAPNIFWYPASGLDLKPAGSRLAEEWSELRDLSLFIYCDYSEHYGNNLLKWYDLMDEEDVTLDEGGHLIPQNEDIYRLLAFHLMAGPDYRREEFDVRQMVPLRIADSGIGENLQRLTQLRSGHSSHAEKPHDLLFWIIELEADDDVVSPIFFAPVDHLALLTEVLAPAAVPIKILCAKTDGCRRGGAWGCCNDTNGAFFRTVIDSPCRPRFWVTDHWSGPYEPGFRRLAVTEDWRGYDHGTGLYSIHWLPVPKDRPCRVQLGALTLTCRFADMTPHLDRLPAALLPASIMRDSPSPAWFRVSRAKHFRLRSAEDVLQFLQPAMETLIARGTFHLGLFAFGAESLRYDEATFSAVAAWVQERKIAFEIELFLLHVEDFTGSIWATKGRQL